jgi:hypothetical protein
VAGPAIGLVIVSLLALGNKRFGVVGGVTDLVPAVSSSASAGRSPTPARAGPPLSSAAAAHSRSPSPPGSNAPTD